MAQSPRRARGGSHSRLCKGALRIRATKRAVPVCFPHCMSRWPPARPRPPAFPPGPAKAPIPVAPDPPRVPGDGCPPGARGPGTLPGPYWLGSGPKNLTIRFRNSCCPPWIPRASSLSCPPRAPRLLAKTVDIRHRHPQPAPQAPEPDRMQSPVRQAWGLRARGCPDARGVLRGTK